MIFNRNRKRIEKLERDIQELKNECRECRYSSRIYVKNYDSGNGLFHRESKIINVADAMRKIMAHFEIELIAKDASIEIIEKRQK